MKNRMLALALGASVLTAIILLSLLPPEFAGAQGDPTNTPQGLSGFLIPTTTPEQETGDGGGLVIPTATTGAGDAGGGLVIPTSTPAGGAGPALPTLDEDGLLALNLQPADVPAEFAANAQSATMFWADTVASLREQGNEELAGQLETAINTYGWDRYVAVLYGSCQPNLPVSYIYSDVAQLTSPEAARAYIADPAVQDLFRLTHVSFEPVTFVNGWLMVTEPSQGDCFAQAVDHDLTFEYWGLVITLSMTADANTDPALVRSLLEQLVPVMIARVDALAATPFPPTPVPGAGTGDETATGLVIPTQAPPTEEVAKPTPAVGFLQSTPDQPTTSTASLADIEGIMPTVQEIGLPSPPFQLDQTLSGTYSLAELVALQQSAGLDDIAAATNTAGQRDGLIGMVDRTWNTGRECPDMVALGAEVSVTLFQTAQGAQSHLNDQAIKNAWLETGLYNNWQVSGNTLLITGGSAYHQCGVVSFFIKNVQHGRMLVSVSISANAAANAQDILSALDLVSNYLLQKIDQAGLS